jgi:hypothetical protein
MIINLFQFSSVDANGHEDAPAGGIGTAHATIRNHGGPWIRKNVDRLQTEKLIFYGLIAIGVSLVMVIVVQSLKLIVIIPLNFWNPIIPVISRTFPIFPPFPTT